MNWIAIEEHEYCGNCKQSVALHEGVSFTCPDTFKKNDKDKDCRPELISHSFLQQLGILCAKGAVKYGADNWRKGTEWRRYLGAMMRHILRFSLGESYDSETNVHHLICAAWSCMALFEMDTQKFGTDDRVGMTFNGEKHTNG